ncbi:MAG: DUF2076 family protein [Buchnera aphidicola (Nurudea ibofushi)]
MNNDEKKLIEDLFSRLHKTEIKSGDRDNIAENLIKELLEKYPNTPYYMAQTLLIQETAIKKLNEKLSSLENDKLKNDNNSKGTSGSFLSNLFGSKKSKNSSEPALGTSCNFPKDSNVGSPSLYTRSNTMSPTGVMNNNSSSFLGGALQTAAGVAGGVVMANALMNLFQNKKPEEEVMDAVHNVDSSNIGSHTLDSDHIHNQYINNEDVNLNNNDTENYNRLDDISDSNDYDDFDDDNFI